MMEKHLLGALSPVQSFREESNKFLQDSEKSPGFCLQMIQTFQAAQDQVKTLALISLKNCIQKHWNNSKRIPLEEKERVKNFLVSCLNTKDIHQKFVAEAVIAVNKHDFLDTWKDLTTFFAVFQFDEFYLRLFHAVLKVQLKKGSARCKTNLKSTFKQVEDSLRDCWRRSQDGWTSKLMMKSLIFNESVELLSEVLTRSFECLTSGHLKLVKIYTKGLNQLLFRSPGVLSNLLEPVISLYLNILLSRQDDQVLQETTELVFSGLVELISKFPQTLPLLEPHLDLLLEKSLKFDEEDWNLWQKGDHETFLMTVEDSEVIRNFQERLFQSFPRLLVKVAGLLNQELDFNQVHSLCGLYGILSKFPESSESDYQLIVSKFSQVAVEGIQRLVLFRDLMVLTKKWLALLKDLWFVFDLLLNIKRLSSDWVVLYEACLVLKQMTYNPTPPDLLVRIVEEFALVAFELIRQVSTPACVWHLTGFIRNLIEASSNDLVFIQALKDFGLQRLIVDPNEMTVQSIGDMIESLLVKNKGNEQINQAFSSNLHSRLSRKDRDAVSHWLTFLLNFSGDLRHVDCLTQFFSMISTKQFAIQVKIAEEYLLIYYEAGFPLKIEEFVKNFLNFQMFSRDFERDYLSLELLFCISSVYQPNLAFAAEVFRYLDLSPEDTFELLCIQNALLVLCRFILADSQQMLWYGLTGFLRKLSLLSHHNHLVFASAALTRVAGGLNEEDLKAVEAVLNYQSAGLSLSQLPSRRFLLLFQI